ncbi:hypothetical protein YM304_02560 [Ilumatobacter coccineus YM16-304]|uniref:N-acetyltransferase domain-containing protein n=2 Tax=Ilumatobacter coccineus TaxID=467094 RepID=A0A6C7E0L0_ILUCY|nr:hypothetical protein YM304_02560 [Ilumatobacter coccineus YM16-304]
MRPADLPVVLQVNQANVPEVGDLDLDRLRFIVDEAAIALVVERMNERDPERSEAIVGFCLVLAPGSTYDSVNYRWFMQHHPDSMYLDRVAFTSDARGQGLGSQLYDTVDDIMREEHPEAPALTLEVNVDPPNEPSLAFHAKHGFVEVGRQISHGIEVSLMRRAVSPQA